MDFVDKELPRGCPPSSAFLPEDVSMFRIITHPGDVTEMDFFSYKQIDPSKTFPDECRARGVSILDSIENCKKMFYLPSFKAKKANSEISIGKIDLKENYGYILKTEERHKGHFTWWVTKDFHFSACKIVEICR